jgi:hypothetical protein
VPEVPEGILARVARINEELTRRANRYRLLEGYDEGRCPPPRAVTEARVTQAYRRLIPISEAPWGSLVVDSVQDRLELSGLRSGNEEVDKRLGDVWQRNFMDSESKLAHRSALVGGRSFAIVWPGQDYPNIYLDNGGQCVVQYAPGSRHTRVAALRRWIEEDDGRPRCTYYTKDYIWKFIGPKDTSGQAGTQWMPRVVPDEDWPLPNRFEEVPVVEIAVNRRLKPGEFGHARGEFEHALGLIDRINLLTFIGLVVAFYLGFPLRGVIGNRILKDDNNEPIAPFKALANEVFQLENPQARIDQYPAADRSNLAVFDELSQLAMLTKTPRHYFPYSGGLSNISADAIRADEGGLNAKVVDHKAGLGDSWLEVYRLCGMMMPDGEQPIELSPGAFVGWKDHESRSLAERADAFTKLAPFLPWQVVVERVLNATPDEIRRWEKLRKDEKDVLAGLLAAAAAQQPKPTAQPEDVPTAPGAGNGVPHVPSGA